ncbi:MAG: class I SAM-dependent methyltransferase [Bacteroidaceae bacterium]|nr:class I SAM-dependent methyltransferase [Bacteroidaceae bacterium]
MASAQFEIAINDASSLVRVGMNPHPTDSGDTTLAYTLLNALDNNHPDSIEYVCRAWTRKAADDTQKEKAWGALAYILNRMLEERKGQFIDQADILTEDLYRQFTDNKCYKLKEYLVLKFELNGYKPRSVKLHIAKRTYYDDMLMFNDPTRNKWDHTEQIMHMLPISNGSKVVDMGCGFGYNTLRLSERVGEKGIVYATDTEQSYIKYVNDIMVRNGIHNVIAINTQTNTLGIEDTVDCILISSLYHIIYTWSREDERKSLLSSIKEHLHKNGYIVVVDNYNLHGMELNNCHVDPQLVEAQLAYWGFRRKSILPLSNQRYMMIFQQDQSYQPHLSAEVSSHQPNLSIENQQSIIHIGSLDSYDITDRGIDAAQYVYDFMGGGQPELAEIAIRKYEELIPQENFGGEYSALQWLCKARLATAEQRETMLTAPLTRSFYNYLTADSCNIIRYYLLHKYKLGNDSIRMISDSLLEMSGEVGRTHRSYLEDYILALNPLRPQWEKTETILSNIPIKAGMKVADIGSGSGFFTTKFAEMTGDEGIVYALELKEEHINRLQSFITENSISNIRIIRGKEDILKLPEQVDIMFMCSLYHILYGVIPDNDRHTYLTSLVEQLKPGGELIIVDNSPVCDDTLPYHGPYIDRRLIERQLSFYGFQLVDYIQVIPQRYLLRFKLVP